MDPARRIRPPALAGALAVLLVLWAPSPAGSEAPGPLRKVSPSVLRATEAGRAASFVVVLGSRADLSPAASLEGKDEKGAFVYRTLRRHAERTQAPVRGLLDRMGVSYRPHVVANAITVAGDRRLVERMAARADVESVVSNAWVRSSLLPVSGPAPAAGPSSPGSIEWNVRRVKAPRVWRQGFLGQGVVLGNIDTGQQWTHPALQGRYRGWTGGTAAHDHHWYDQINPSNRAPVDPNGHGTHTAGTMLGNSGSNHIGVAPGARWMACRSMNAFGFGRPETYLGCMEFMLAPWDLDGNDPDPAMAPDAVSNSWNCSISLEDCTQGLLAEVVHNLRMAGIAVVVAAGNSGPACATVGADGPPAQYDDSYTVGATTRSASDELASFSSRGPATFLGRTLVKPDIVAPGEGVRSSYPPNGYAVLSGTSMAAPHVAGVLALVWSANPGLRGHVGVTEALLNATAVHRRSSQCGSSGGVPNNLFGYGLVDAAASVRPAMAASGLGEAAGGPVRP